MPDYDPLRSYMHNWFMSIHVKQYFIEFLAWEKFFLKCGQIRRIVELGSGMGGFSLFLYLHAGFRNASFYTWDVNAVHMATRPFAEKIGFSHHCYQGDVLKDEQTIEQIRNVLSLTGKTLLFCDNGHKATEVKLYVPSLKPGDYLAVHDWEHEIFPKHIEGLPLKAHDVEHIVELGCWTRFFEVTG